LEALDLAEEAAAVLVLAQMPVQGQGQHPTGVYVRPERQWQEATSWH